LDLALDPGFKVSMCIQLLGDNAPVIDLESLDQPNGIESGIGVRWLEEGLGSVLRFWLQRQHAHATAR
jgi:hypothetical protein